MNITDNLIRIKEGKEQIIQSLKNKGVSIADNTLINEIPTIIDNAEIGGGGDTPIQPETPELVQKYEGASVFRINVPTDNYEFAINLCNKATATYDVDWGDGSLEYGLTTDEQHHIYSKSGTYDVNVYNLSTNIILGGSSVTSGDNQDKYYLFNNTNNDYWGGNKYILNKDNTTVTNILIGVKIKSFGYYAFQSCSSLQSVVIPEGVTSIANQTFQSCSSLQSITCKALTAPTITNNTFPTGSLRYTKRYLYIHKDADIESYTSGNWKTYLIDNGWELRYIEDYPKVPTTIKLKTRNNFFHNLQAIGQANLINYELIDNEYIYHFDNKITELSYNTFYKKVLEEIELPEGLEIMGNECLRECISLQSVVIPNSVTTIGDYAFYGCSNLSTITCKALTAPTIQSNTFTYIGTKLPSGTPKVLRVPEGATGYDSGNWKTYVLNKGYTLEYIVPNTLTYTSYNGDIVTPYAKSFEGKNEIVSNVYENGIGTLTFKEGLTEIYDSMYNKDIVSGLTNIEIPNGITRIGNYSFRSQNLTTLNVPNTVTYIGDSAFNGCTNLTEITLGSSVETIGQWAFSSCTKIATITSMAMVAPTLNQSFLNVGGDVSGDKILRVPEGAEGYDTWLSQLGDFTIEYI